MVIKKKNVKTTVKSSLKKHEKRDLAEEKRMERNLKEVENELDEIEEQFKHDLETNFEEQKPVTLKASKPISQIKKGDKIKVDGVVYEVDAHEVLIDHGTTKEMAIEVFNPKTDKDYQLRYFSDQVENTVEFYELQEIIYVKKNISIVEW